MPWSGLDHVYCFALAGSPGWTLVDASEKEMRIEATDKSFWFGRISDVVIRVRPAACRGHGW